MEPGVVMNAAAHIALGLGGMAPNDTKGLMKFMSYTDADNRIHPDISAWPLIILRGKADELIYYGIGIFAKPEELDPLTKKFSLWK